MFALTRFATSTFSAIHPCLPNLRISQLCFFSVKKGKTNVLKAKEKAKLRRLRINKPDKPAQAKRGARVSKL